MKEKVFISTIKNVLNSNYIGDDCAYLPDLGIVVTQDSLVEDVHFSLDFMSPYQLGYKFVMVNISDVVASGAKPKYLTVALSIPTNIDENFIKEFYQGAKDACGNEIEIVGGDITRAEKVFISPIKQWIRSKFHILSLSYNQPSFSFNNKISSCNIPASSKYSVTAVSKSICASLSTDSEPVTCRIISIKLISRTA